VTLPHVPVRSAPSAAGGGLAVGVAVTVDLAVGVRVALAVPVVVAEEDGGSA
jgi:hypothetical protein